jgi:hypothetical protein
MKHILHSILVSLCTIGLSAQAPMEISVTFENDAFDHHQQLIAIDSSDSANCWQIAMQQKFITGNGFYQMSHVIITDSVNAYPSADTSSFIYSTYPHDSTHFFPIMSFDYRIDADSTDHGLLELSLDNGQSWTDVFDPQFGTGVNVTNYNSAWQANQFTHATSADLFTGSQVGWLHFDLQLTNVNLWTGLYDTILFRFTFFSDSINTNKDGWMIDMLDGYDYLESVSDQSNTENELVVYPSPVSDVVHITAGDRTGTITILDAKGNEIMNAVMTGKMDFDLSSYSHGLYLVVMTDEHGKRSSKRIVH